MSMMKIVSQFECESPYLFKIFESDYRYQIMKSVNTAILNNVKELVERYLDNYLVESLVSYKVYAYKSIDGITVEILMKPCETANILEYHLMFNAERIEIQRVR